MAGNQISVVVVDDHPMFRSGLIHALSIDDDFSVIGEGGSAAEAVDLVRDLRPSVLLLDAWMDDCGIDRVGDILSVHPDVRIVMVTASEDEGDVARALQAGVAGYVLKGTTGPEIRAIIRSVHAGENYIARAVTGALWGALKSKAKNPYALERDANLSKQEENVLRLLATGLNNREIGVRLSVTEKTVKFHLSSVFRKLGVTNRVQASISARKMWSELAR
jgi:two-component system, NarL family, nitrate/nitrite response regulator NarL